MEASNISVQARDLADCLVESTHEGEMISQARQHTFAIPALGRLRQKDLGFQVILLGYTASFRLAWVTWVDPILKQPT